MLTLDDAKAYLAQLGLTLPDTMLGCLIEQLAAIEACLIGAGYTDCQKSLIESYVLGLLAISSGARRVTSESAPSGASRSYSYGSLSEQMRQLRNSLAIVDTSGCSAALIPAEPGAAAGLWVATPCLV